jgi:hypothetical protein
LGTSFPTFFFEQGFDRELFRLGIASLIFLVALASVLFFLRRRLSVPVVTAVAASSALVLVVAVVGITLFEAAALWYRSVPHGSGHERPGGGAEDFYSWARVGFIALYAGLVLIAIGCGWVLGVARTRRGAAVAAVTGIAIVVYLALTLPLVEFQNTCNVGRSFLIDNVSC